MDYPLISKKVFSSFVVFVGIYILTSSIYSLFFRKNEIFVCSDGIYNNIIVHNKSNIILVVSGPLKNTLDCLGREMRFYERSVDIVISEHMTESSKKELSRRYFIKKHFDGFEGRLNDSIQIQGQYLMINVRNKYFISKKQIVNPFLASRLIHTNKPTLIIAPKLTKTILSLIHKDAYLRTIKLVELREGEFIDVAL